MRAEPGPPPAPRRRAAAMRRAVALGGALCLAAAASPLRADDPEAEPRHPSRYFAAPAVAALETCLAANVRPAEVGTSCAFSGARVCEAADPDGRSPAAQEACALAEYRWWLVRIETRLGEISRLLAVAGTSPERDVAMLESAQAAWAAHARAQCNLETLALGHWSSITACLTSQAARRAAWVLGPAGEF